MSDNSYNIRSFSERLMPPYSGQIQITESDTYRALTIDGEVWEIQYVNRSHVRVTTLQGADIRARSVDLEQLEGGTVDKELAALLEFLADVELPFAATDVYEYWLLDAEDQAPLALIFSCSESAQMEKFPSRPEWTALPAAVMPVKKTSEEEDRQAPPVNYQLELLVAERSGTNSKARWFNRKDRNDVTFPPFMVREDWADPAAEEICRRYLARQAPRLLMQHGLSAEDRTRLEEWCRDEAIEVARFVNLYPEVIDQESMQALCVEARFRAAHERDGKPTVHSRRDGVLYI